MLLLLNSPLPRRYAVVVTAVQGMGSKLDLEVAGPLVAAFNWECLQNYQSSAPFPLEKLRKEPRNGWGGRGGRVP
jgi:hypothetical protein